MNDFIVKQQQLPEDFKDLLIHLRTSRDPALPMVLRMAKLNGWTYKTMAKAIGVSGEWVRLLVGDARPSAGQVLPEIPLPPRRPAPPAKPARRRLLVNPQLANELRAMAEIAATVNGGTPTNAPERQVSEEFTAMLASLVKQGVTVYTLAQILDVTPSAVAHRLGRHGYRKSAPSQERVRYLGHPSKRSSGTQDNCKRGHPLSGSNLYVVPKTGSRVCRACDRLRHEKYLERKAAARLSSQGRAS